MRRNAAWYRVPAWWVPAFLETRPGTGALDPLERAVLRFLALDIAHAPRTPEAMAQTLRMDAAMLHGAMARLHGAGRVEPLADGAWARVEGDEEAEPQRERREAWVPWDPVDDRPLLGMWLGPTPPLWVDGPSPDVADGWGPSPALERPTRPRRDVVDRALRLLTSVDGPLVLEAIGRHAELFQGDILRLYPRLSRPRWGWMAVYVEHRATGSAVWRPQPAPTQEVETELDPGGWPRFLARVGDRRQRLEEEEDARMVGRDVLARLQVATVDELRAKVRVRLDLQLEGVSEALRDAAVEASVQHELAKATGQPWRHSLTGWTEVLERWLREVSEDVALPALQNLDPPAMDWQVIGARAATFRDRLGPTWGHVEKSILKKREVRELAQLLEDDRATGGVRVLALGAAMVLDQAAEVQLVALDEQVAETAGTGLFPTLKRLVNERNAIAHAHREAREVGGIGFRTGVLDLLKAQARTRTEEER